MSGWDSGWDSCWLSHSEPLTDAFVLAWRPPWLESMLAASRYARPATHYSFWALVHGLAMLQITFLQHFDANFPHLDPAIIAKFITGLGQQPS